MLTNLLIMLLSIGIPLAIAVGGMLLWRAQRRRDKRRSPLKDKILNLPGEYLRKQISTHRDAYDEAAIISLLIGPICLCAWLLLRMDWNRVRFAWGDAMFVLLALGFVAWSLWQMISHASQARSYREGLDAELAVAQSLTQLNAEGGLVFHDFPCDRFNIDHIVVGRSVVFAIETKSRKKPVDNGRESARVTYDGTRLAFPDKHTESKPIEQARYQAEWLGKFLANGAGESIRVVPVVALPGWYVESVNAGRRPDVLVTNCHNPMFMAGDKFGPPMTESLRKRIAHVLFEKYPSLDEFLDARTG